MGYCLCCLYPCFCGVRRTGVETSLELGQICSTCGRVYRMGPHFVYDVQWTESHPLQNQQSEKDDPTELHVCLHHIHVGRDHQSDLGPFAVLHAGSENYEP